MDLSITESDSDPPPSVILIAINDRKRKLFTLATLVELNQTNIIDDKNSKQIARSFCIQAIADKLQYNVQRKLERSKRF